MQQFMPRPLEECKHIVTNANMPNTSYIVPNTQSRKSFHDRMSKSQANMSAAYNKMIADTKEEFDKSDQEMLGQSPDQYKSENSQKYESYHQKQMNEANRIKTEQAAQSDAEMNTQSSD